MEAYLEVGRPTGVDLVPLEEPRTTLGRADSNDVCLSDPEASRLHAVIERYPSGWCLRDLGSRNGTHLNGQPVLGEQFLSPGDEFRIGSSVIVFKAKDRQAERPTQTAVAPPELTRREREVLVELCRPLAETSGFAQPATVKAIAAALVVTPATVKFHLGHLYEKFGVNDPGSGRRALLANDALLRGAVSTSDLRRT